MAMFLQYLHLIAVILIVSIKLFSTAKVEGDDQFIYNGFQQAKLNLEGPAKIHSSGLLQLTTSMIQPGHAGHAFYQVPLKFNNSSSSGGLYQPFSFSTNFVFAIVSEFENHGAHGLAFIVSPFIKLNQAFANQYLGLFNSSNNGNPSNRVIAVEFDTVKNPEFEDINENHVGIDLYGLNSTVSVPTSYFSNSDGTNRSLVLASGKAIQVWMEYKSVRKLLDVTLAPIGTSKPNKPLLSATVDFSPIATESLYVGFSASTGSLLPTDHYILGWSFNTSGPTENLDVSKLPSFPQPNRRRREKSAMPITISAVVALFVVLITVAGAVYIVRREKFLEIREDWEREYGPQRFSYKSLYKATKGFHERELLGAGGFGRVYRGTLASSNKQVAVKKVSHDSAQGVKEFVAEVACMRRLRHRNLVGLLGYCRRRGELLLVYDFMKNGSLDKLLFGNEKSILDWARRYQILKGIASGILYLHEEWEQVILHRDVKASNVLLDDDLNGRLGDFGLARLYDHGTNPQTTRVVGTIGYLAPELTRTSKASKSSDVYAFGAFMLEVACGRRPVEPKAQPDEMFLVDWIFENWKQGKHLETVDPKLNMEFVVEEVELVLKLGLLCSQSNPEARPTMRQVMQYLDGSANLLEMHPSDCSIGFQMIPPGNEESAECPVPSSSSPSSGRVSVASISSTSSILNIGR